MDSHVLNRVEMIDYIDTLLEFADMVTVSHEVLSFSVGKNTYSFTQNYCKLGMQRFDCDSVLFVFGHGTFSVIINLPSGVDIAVDFPRKDRE